MLNCTRYRVNGRVLGTAVFWERLFWERPCFGNGRLGTGVFWERPFWERLFWERPCFGNGRVLGTAVLGTACLRTAVLGTRVGTCPRTAVLEQLF